MTKRTDTFLDSAEERARLSITSMIGVVLDDRYKLTGLVGEGAMGAVYRAEQDDGPTVAVKVLREELGDNAELRERFEREARALFGLEHPHILNVYDFGVHKGSPYIVTELLTGKALGDLLEDGELDPTSGAVLFEQALAGLSFAHGEGVLHRDVKPDNVFIQQPKGEPPTAKLLDFGLVKFVDDDRWGESKALTVQGSVFGTPAYMAPEQCAGAPTDARTDVYAMGAVLFETLTGKWPFMEESRMEMFRAHLTDPVPSIGANAPGLALRPQVEDIVQRAMAKSPDDRFQDATEMLLALRKIKKPLVWHADVPPTTPGEIRAEPEMLTPSMSGERSPSDRRLIFLLTGAVIGLILALLIVVFLVMP